MMVYDHIFIVGTVGGAMYAELFHAIIPTLSPYTSPFCCP